MPAKKHRSRRRMSTLHDVNVTNLVDVTMVLLIIFILITPLIQEGFNLTLPETATAERIDESDAILVVLEPDGKVTVNGLRVDEADLRDHILAAHRLNPEMPVLVQSDESLAYGKVIAVIDAVRAAGITNVGLVTENKDNTGLLR